MLKNEGSFKDHFYTIGSLEYIENFKREFENENSKKKIDSAILLQNKIIIIKFKVN